MPNPRPTPRPTASPPEDEGGLDGGCTEITLTEGVDATLTPVTPPEARADSSVLVVASMPFASVAETAVAVEESAKVTSTTMRTEAEVMVSSTESTGTFDSLAKTLTIAARVEGP